MGNWQHTAGQSPPQAEGSFSYREAGREKKRKNGEIFSVPIVHYVLTIF